MSSHTYGLFRDACWMAVQMDVAAFQAEYFKSLKGTPSDLTPETATTECVNLDTMVRRFVAKYQIGEDVQYTAEDQKRLRLADLDLTARWREYFMQRAELRLVLATDALHYEPSDSALYYRARIRQMMIEQGYQFGGNPK